MKYCFGRKRFSTLKSLHIGNILVALDSAFTILLIKLMKFLVTMLYQYLIIHGFVSNLLVNSQRLQDDDENDLYMFTTPAYDGSFPIGYGEVYPIPKFEHKRTEPYEITLNLEIEINRSNADYSLLRKVTDLFLKRLSTLMVFAKNGTEDAEKYSKLKVIEIHLDGYNYYKEHANSKMIENFEMDVAMHTVIETPSIWGVIRALDTFLQLCYVNEEGILVVQKNTIEDAPKYQHRGLMIDTESHYISVDNIMKMIDAMAMNKLNVLHWRIVGDTSFPYESNILPELSENGALHHSMVYNETSIRQILEFAALRGVRVIPEFNIPGHMWSVRKSHPELITKCLIDNDGPPSGPLNPAQESTFEFLKILLNEVQEQFPDEYIHIGGEDVDENCWISNPDVQQYVKEHLENRNLHLLFVKYLFDVVLQPHKNLIVAQEVLNHGVMDGIFPNDTIIQAYREDLYRKMADHLHHPIILTWPWDLSDQLNLSFAYTYIKAEETLIKSGISLRNCIGGEAFLIHGVVDDTNILDKVWPRMCAIADVLWHGIDEANNVHDTRILKNIHRRIQDQMNRMALYGIPVSPMNAINCESNKEIKFKYQRDVCPSLS